MKICLQAGAVKQIENYFSISTDGVEIRIWFLTDSVVRIRAGFDGDFVEESYSLVTTAWEDRMDMFMRSPVDRWVRKSGNPGKSFESRSGKKSISYLCL